MDQDPQIKTKYGHAEASFDGDRAGLDTAYAWLRHAVGDTEQSQLLGDVLLILAGNAIRHSDTGHGGRFTVQAASMRGKWILRVDDEGHVTDHPHLMRQEKGEPLHGLASLNLAGIVWTLPGPGAIHAEIECLLPGEVPPDLSVPAKRAVESVL